MKKYFELSPIQSKINFSALDCLRGLAAVYVVLNHARGHLFAGGSYLAKIKPVSEWSFVEKAHMALLQLTSLGNEFVIFFFILSGFSIAFSMHRSGKLAEFYKRRLIRIYPPYLLGIAWAIFVWLLIRSYAPEWTTCDPDNYTAQRLCGNDGFLQVKNIIANCFYFPNGSLIPQYWSLPHEIIFYACIPFFIRSVKWYMIFSVLIYFTVVAFRGITFTNSGYKALDYVVHYNFYFAIGVFLYYYKHLITNVIWKAKQKWLFFAAFAVVFLLMIATKFKLGDYNAITELLAVVLSVISIKYFLNANYVPRLLEFFGKFSYTIYIGHFAALYLFKTLLNIIFGYGGQEITNGWIWMGGALFALLCCYVLYFLAEKPSKIYLDRLRKK